QRTTGFLTRLSVTNGKSYASQASIPPSSGRTLVMPLARSSSATRALVASLGAVEDDVAVPGNLSVAVCDCFHSYTKRARDHLRKRLDIHGLAQVHDRNVFSGREFVHEFFRSDARNPQPTKEALALDELPQNISCQTSGQDRDLLKLIAENQAQARE